MEIKLEIPEYSPDSGITFKWEPNSSIKIKFEDGKVILMANTEGLISFANHLLNLAQANIPSGYHVHFDQYNSLEDDSIEIIIEKK